MVECRSSNVGLCNAGCHFVFQIRSTDISRSSAFASLLRFGRSLAVHTAWRPLRYGAGLHGGTMKTLSDVAASYDECAQANEATAEKILACLDSFAAEIRDTQRWRAGWLTADAAQLRFRAAELRTVERRINELGLIVSSGKSAEN